MRNKLNKWNTLDMPKRKYYKLCNICLRKERQQNILLLIFWNNCVELEKPVYLTNKSNNTYCYFYKLTQCGLLSLSTHTHTHNCYYSSRFDSVRMCYCFLDASLLSYIAICAMRLFWLFTLHDSLFTKSMRII